jgi:hypothetical protein
VEDGDRHGRVEQPEELGNVDVLACQAGADHVVRVSQQFYAGAVQVGVQAAGRHEHRLAGLQDRVAEQERRGDADVARVLVGQADYSCARGRVGTSGGVELAWASGRGGGDPLASGYHIGDEGGTVGGRPGEDRGQGAADRFGGTGGSHLDTCGQCHFDACGVEAVNRQRAEKLGGVGRGAHAREDLERGERAQQLGLGPVVDVVPGGIAWRQSASDLVRVALLGLGSGRVHLDRQRLLGGQHLEQERQTPAKARGAIRTELMLRRCPDDVVEVR